MSDELKTQRTRAIADALSIGQLERHVLLCAQQKNPRCCSYEESTRVWKYLKTRLKELGLASAPPPWQGQDTDTPPPPTTAGNGRVLRTKVDCLRICEAGPIAVIYPDGVWYHSVDEQVMERIIQEHLIGGTAVEEYVFARDRLANR
ncbi:MAG: hypothetical protein H6707_05415 [Deltaproteobacteria bacterium]|nr:hypothetical protein [Deltaproteobacteria bacterium]